MASDRMLRGRLPWGLGGAVYLLVCSFIRVRCSSIWEVVDAFYWGSGDAIECCASMLDRTGALIGEQCSSSRYHEGVPTVVVFEISPSHVKTFHHRPNTRNHHHQVLSHAVRRLCVGSGSELRRPRFVAVTTYRCRVRFRRPTIPY